MSPLLLIDLDDSLIDRSGSFAAWARGFCAECGRDGDLDWLIEQDRNGYADRGELFALVRERFGLAETVDELLERYREEHPRHTIPPSPEALERLELLRASGWRVGVVTNGHPVQLVKLAAAGLTERVDACVVSEIAGVRKPDPRIFRLAAERCGASLDGAWMAGDNPDADLRGAHALGLRTIWFRLGRTWTEQDFEPTLAVDSLEEALAHLAQLP
jgi:putative hydrolase of the HAD superfamily